MRWRRLADRPARRRLPHAARPAPRPGRRRRPRRARHGRERRRSRCSTSPRARRRRRRASYAGVRALEVDGDGDVRITGAPAGSPVRVVVTRVTEGLRSPERRAERGADGTLRLSSSCPAPSSRASAPSATTSACRPTWRSVADSGAGDVTAEDLASDAAVVPAHVGGRRRRSAGVDAPALRLHSSAGDVVARDVGSERVRATSSAGDVRVSLRVAPRRARRGLERGRRRARRARRGLPARRRDDRGRRRHARRSGSTRTRRRSIRARSSAGDVRIDAPRR